MKAQTLSVSSTPEDAWADHLQDMFKTLGIHPGTTADNIAASVAVYCRKFHPQGLHTADLKLLISRAFCAVGDRATAGGILETMETHRRYIARWLEILTELHHFPELLPYFSSGIIRPADWAGARQDRMWILDFGRLVLSDGEKHEMMLHRSIQLMIGKMSIFWDATGGEGILGLKSISSLNMDKWISGKSRLTTQGNLMGYIKDLLAQQTTLRGWLAAPSLLNLDL
jgi:hypothetical protein